MSNELLFESLTYSVIGVCYQVQNELGGGLLEKSYQKALVMGLQNKGLKVKEQVKIPIYFQQQLMTTGYADFMVEGQLLLEIKRSPIFNRQHIQQLENYLTSSNLPIGLLIHFGSDRVRIKRVINKAYFNALK